MAKVDLEDVLRRAARRDPDALATLVELYGPRVFGLVLRLTGSRHVAEELTQETFLRVVRTIEQYEHSGKFESWLFRIAANLARDRARQGHRRGWTASLEVEIGGGDDSAAIPRSADADSPEQRLLNKEAQTRLVACLETLTEPEREILLLRHYSGLSFPEIAQMLGVPLGTALARAHRALQRLRAAFENDA